MSKKKGMKIKNHGKPKNEALVALPNVKIPTVPVVKAPVIQAPKVEAPVVEVPKIPQVTAPITNNERYILVDISFGVNDNLTLRSGTRRFYKWMSVKHPYQVILQKENLDLSLSIGDEIEALETGVFKGNKTITKTKLVTRKKLDLSIINGLGNIEEQPGMTLLFPNEVAVLLLKNQPVPTIKGWVGTKLAY